MKRSLKSDDQQFQQYQQNKQSPLTLTHWTHTHLTTTFGVGNPNPCLGQAQKCGGVKYISHHY